MKEISGESKLDQNELNKLPSYLIEEIEINKCSNEEKQTFLRDNSNKVILYFLFLFI